MCARNVKHNNLNFLLLYVGLLWDFDGDFVFVVHLSNDAVLFNVCTNPFHRPAYWITDICFMEPAYNKFHNKEHNKISYKKHNVSMTVKRRLPVCHSNPAPLLRQPRQLAHESHELKCQLQRRNRRLNPSRSLNDLFNYVFCNEKHNEIHHVLRNIFVHERFKRPCTSKNVKFIMNLITKNVMKIIVKNIMKYRLCCLLRSFHRPHCPGCRFPWTHFRPQTQTAPVGRAAGGAAAAAVAAGGGRETARGGRAALLPAGRLAGLGAGRGAGEGGGGGKQSLNSKRAGRGPAPTCSTWPGDTQAAGQSQNFCHGRRGWGS